MITRIKKLGFATVIIAIYGLSVQAQDAQMWMLDKSHSSVNFSINHFFSEVKGNFTDFEGSFHFDPNNVKGSQLAFMVNVKSVNTDDSKRDNHLQSPDFFNASEFPEIKFESTKIKKVGDKQYEATGKLSIKDVTKTIKIPFNITGQMEHPMMKGTIILGVVIDTTIDRTDYGVGTGDWAATMIVGDEVKIHIPMELNRKL